MNVSLPGALICHAWQAIYKFIHGKCECVSMCVNNTSGPFCECEAQSPEHGPVSLMTYWTMSAPLHADRALLRLQEGGEETERPGRRWRVQTLVRISTTTDSRDKRQEELMWNDAHSSNLICVPLCSATSTSRGCWISCWHHRDTQGPLSFKTHVKVTFDNKTKSVRISELLSTCHNDKINVFTSDVWLIKLPLNNCANEIA